MTERFTTRLAVFIILRNKKDEILLQQRANTGYLDGYYDFACSGHVEYGESIQDAAIRELLEEIGVMALPEALRLTHIDQYFIERNYVNFIFTLDEWQGEPTISEPEKCSDLRYFAPTALPEKCVNVLRATERTGFSDKLTYSVTTKESYEVIMGEPFTEKV